MNKSKDTRVLGRANSLDLMDGRIIILTGSHLNVTRFKTETISLAREKSFSVENLL